MRAHLLTALRSLLVLTLLTGLAYPAAANLLAGLLFADEAQGSLIARDGKVVGSRLIGQPFAGPGYFWGRPSATAKMP